MGPIIHTSIIVGGIIVALLSILLAVPGCRLREVLAPIIEWAIRPRSKHQP
jgi:hypothetical protein